MISISNIQSDSFFCLSQRVETDGVVWIAAYTVSPTQRNRVDCTDESGINQAELWVEDDWGRSLCS